MVEILPLLSLGGGGTRTEVPRHVRSLKCSECAHFPQTDGGGPDGDGDLLGLGDWVTSPNLVSPPSNSEERKNLRTPES